MTISAIHSLLMHGGLDVQRLGGDARKLAKPFCPEQERGGGTEAQDEDEGDVAGVGEAARACPTSR